MNKKKRRRVKQIFIFKYSNINIKILNMQTVNIQIFKKFKFSNKRNLMIYNFLLIFGHFNKCKKNKTKILN